MKPRIYRRHPLKYAFGVSNNCRRGQQQNSRSFKVMQKKDNRVNFGLVMCISNMHPTLIKAIGCMKGVIEIVC